MKKRRSGWEAVTKACILAGLLCLTKASEVAGQTFAQLSDMGSNIGPRLTRNVARNRINRTLFGTIGTKVTFINFGTPYQFVTDPLWARVVIGKKDDWVHEYKNSSGPGGRLGAPYGIDISARKYAYIADWLGRRVLVATFSTSSGNLTSPQNLVYSGFGRPIDVAWDGQSTPLTNDYLYVLDDSLARITYWNFNGTTPSSPLWSYGAVGSGTGQFRRPSGLCVGKTGGPSGTFFNTGIFVVDRGNGRVVYMYRGTNGPVWLQTISQPGWDPVDCTVDHFGQLYVTDRAGDKIWKFNSALWLLDSYGSYGTGANNLNTFADPGAISTPCGLKTVNSQTVWYCEGRVITAERWGDSTGAVEHYLGVGASWTGPPEVEDPYAWATFYSTDVAYISADVFQLGVGITKTLMTNNLYSAGQISLWWDGTKNDGTNAADGNYIFRAFIRSSYGCPNNFMYTWCAPNIYSSEFYHRYCVQPPPGGGGGGQQLLASEPLGGVTANAITPPPPQCGGGNLVGPGTVEAYGIPERFGVRQLAAPPMVLPAGLSSLAASGVRPALLADGTTQNVDDGTAATVRQYGINALQVNLSEASDVDVEVFDLSGRRLHRSHTGGVSPGMYIYLWDGSGAQGTRVRPGVYMTVVRAQGRRVISKLILTGAALP